MATRRRLMEYIGTGAIGGIVGYYVGAQELLGIQSEAEANEFDSDQRSSNQPTEQQRLEVAYPAQSGLSATEDVIYATENDEILRIDRANGDITARIDAPAGERAGLAFGGGSLWFSDANGDSYGGEIIELDVTTGDVRSRITVSYDPVALAFGEGSLWACNITANDVVEFAPDGSQQSEFDTRGATGSTEARGLAYANGSLYVGTQDTNTITEFAMDGTSQGDVDAPDRPYRGLAATQNALFGPDENGEVTVLRQFDS